MSPTAPESKPKALAIPGVTVSPPTRKQATATAAPEAQPPANSRAASRASAAASPATPAAASTPRSAGTDQTAVRTAAYESPQPYVGPYDDPFGEDPWQIGKGWPASHFPAVCGRLWVRGEYLLWWSQDDTYPPLVTTSPVGTPPATAGILGQPTTTVLVGGDDLGGTTQPGGRVTIGWCYDDSDLQASFLGLSRSSSSFSATSDQIPILARPFFDTSSNTQAAMLVAHPNLLAGAIAVDVDTEFQAADVLWRRMMYAEGGSRLDFLAGYQFRRLDESLLIRQTSRWTVAQGPIVPGTTQQLFDLFNTENQFQGGVIGLAYQKHCDNWSLDCLMKLGLGNTNSEVLIDGATTTTVPGGGSATFVGGLLAQSTNIGQHEQDNFSWTPELNVNIAWDVTCQLRLLVGYNLIYWTDVARPAGQISTSVSQLPPEAPTGAREPQFRFSDSSFWVQGVQVGLDYRF